MPNILYYVTVIEHGEANESGHVWSESLLAGEAALIFHGAYMCCEALQSSLERYVCVWNIIKDAAVREGLKRAHHSVLFYLFTIHTNYAIRNIYFRDLSQDKINTLIK